MVTKWELLLNIPMVAIHCKGKGIINMKHSHGYYHGKRKAITKHSHGYYHGKGKGITKHFHGCYAL